MNPADEDRTGNEGRPRSVMNMRRKQALIAMAGLAGVGAFFISTQFGDRNASTGAFVPMVSPSAPATVAAPAASSPAAASILPTSPRKTAVAQSSSSSPPSARKASVKEEIRQAREAAARDGYPVQRPLVPGAKVATAPVNTRTEQRGTGTVRIVSARFDLTGQREHLWAGDEGRIVGDARCTQNIRFSRDQQPSLRPSMLLCWRMSATRSVVVVLIDRSGKPSVTESLKIIGREWGRLG